METNEPTAIATVSLVTDYLFEALTTHGKRSGDKTKMGEYVENHLKSLGSWTDRITVERVHRANVYSRGSKERKWAEWTEFCQKMGQAYPSQKS